MVPVIVDGQTLRLEMRIYKPTSAEPVPTLVFNHGSTGRGRDPSLFTRPIDFPALAQFFVQRGWAVVMPARRGRAGSEGVYDEGFAMDRALGYTCDPAHPGAPKFEGEFKHGHDLLYLSGEFSRLTCISPRAVTCHGPCCRNSRRRRSGFRL